MLECRLEEVTKNTLRFNMPIEYRVVWKSWKDQINSLILYEGPKLDEAEKIFKFHSNDWFISGDTKLTPYLALEKRSVIHSKIIKVIDGKN